MGGVRKKKSTRKILAKVFEIKNWKLFLVLILVVFLAATQLRIDHLRMIEYKKAVFDADAANDDEAIASALENLHQFTSSHIIFNTTEENGDQRLFFGTGAFYLSNLYHRRATEALQIAQDKILEEDPTMSAYGNIYKKVADICDAEGKKHGWRYPNKHYLDCFINKLADYPESEQVQVSANANLPSTELFRYDYSSPVWCWCLSGALILICIILLIIIIIRILIWIFTTIAILIVR